MNVTTGVVLAAGEGTRLRPLTRNRPKPMLPAANRPILEHVLDALVDAGIERIVLIVGHRRERVQEHFGPSYRDVPLTYVVQSKQLGSGHALLQARDAVEGPVLAVNGDRVIDAGMVRDVCEGLSDELAATLGVIQRPDASQYGAVVVQDGDLSAIIEKPDSDEYRLINAGIYAFGSDVFDALADTPRQDGELKLPDTIAELVERGRVAAIRTEGLWVDATFPWDLLTVAREVLARGRVAEPEREPQVWVSEDARVHESAVLRGPVVVGDDCEIGPGAVVGPDVGLGRNVTVGANATVERSVLDSDTRVQAGSTLVETVTGQDVHLGAGTVVPGGPADVRVDTRIYEEQHLGAVFADRVRAEGDVSAVPGTLVGPGAYIHTGARISGQIPSETEVMR